jgi:hypothetical protein
LRSPKLPGTDIDWNQSCEFALWASPRSASVHAGLSGFAGPTTYVG